MDKTILGIFADRAAVEEVIARLEAKGFNPKDISIVMKDKREQEEIGNDTGTNVTGGALSGASTGAVVGGIAGLLAGTVLPGLGGFLIGGPIGAALGLTGAAATTVSGVATGAVAGGLIGALMGLGLKRDEAEHYQQRVEEGAILIAVPADAEEESYVRGLFDEYNAEGVRTITHDREETDTRDQFADQRGYAMSAKGGKATHAEGKGWHGDSARHAAAGRGENTRDEK